MNNRKKASRDELISMLPQSGWDWASGGKSLNNGKLEDLVRAAHERHRQGEEAGVIKKIEAELEVDLIQLQELWVHLGLPI